MASREAIYQEFYNNDDLQGMLLHNVQPTGTHIASGCSTFGKVEKIKVGLTIRAGKIFDDKIYSKTIQQLSKTIIVTNFVRECKCIAGIDHPNIIKVIGMCMLSNQIFPTVVMELLDNNLHQYLVTHHSIPLVIKQTILEDVAKGLLFLHAQSPDPIVHCDLTAYNVLLTSSLVAKVSDVGNSSFADLAKRHDRSVAYSQRVKVYLPPECDHGNGKCCPSMDLFSYGHLVLFCSIQVFPDELLPSTYSYHDTAEMLVLRSEVDRRKEYFKQMDLKLPHGNKHPLVELAQECLQDDPTKRPLTENVLERLRQMVDEMGRIPDDQDTMDRMEVIQLLYQQDSLHTMMPKEKEEYLSRIYALDSENEDMRMKIHSIEMQSSKDLEDKDKIISNKNIQLLEIEQQVEKLQAEQTMSVLRFKEALSSIIQRQDQQKQLLSECREKVKAMHAEEEEILAKGDMELSQLIREAQLLVDPVTMPGSPKKFSVLDLSWEQLPDLPAPLGRTPCAVYLNGFIYVGGFSAKDHAHTVFVYSPDQPDTWSQLAHCPRKNFGMAAVKNTLVIVGGVDSTHRKSSKVTVWDSTAQQWKEGFYPSLLQARASPHVTTFKNWLLVIGGTADKTLNILEKLDTDSNKSWTHCPPLLNRCADISSVVIDHTLYITGTAIGTSETGKVVYSILLPLLVRVKAKDTSIWEKLPNIPNSTSTLCSVSRKSILAFGGEPDVMSSLAILSPVLSLELQEGAGIKWERVGSLPFERNSCTCLCVGSNKVVLLGGTQPQAPEGLRRVDVGTLQGQR